MIKYDKMTQRAQEALEAAVQIAKENSQQQIDVEHLLAGLLSIEESIPVAILEKLNADVEAFRSEIKGLIEKKPKVQGGNAQEYLSQRLNQLFDRALQEAETLKDEFVSTE